MSTVILFLEQLRGYTGKPKGRQAPPTEIPKTIILEQKELQTSQPKSLILLRRRKERHGKGTELTQGPTASQHPSSPLALALRACKPGGQQEGTLLEEQQQQKNGADGSKLGEAYPRPLRAGSRLPRPSHTKAATDSRARSSPPGSIITSGHQNVKPPHPLLEKTAHDTFGKLSVQHP